MLNLFSWNRLVQFRLRTILIVTALLAIAFGIARKAMLEANDQKEIVNRIRTNGAVVYYDFGYDDDGTGNGVESPPGPAWLHDALGVDFFSVPFAVNLSAGNTDADLRQIARLTAIRGLYIDGANITDNGIVAIRKLNNLKWLGLYDTSISDAAVAVIRDIPTLESVDIRRTNISPDGKRRLKAALPNCVIYWEE